MHVIHQLRIETSAAGGRLGRAADRAVAAGVEKLPAALDECFDLAAGGASLRIERLEIDLGTLSWAEFERGFAERAAAAVLAKIRPEAVRVAAGGGRKGEPARQGERVEAWTFFLRHGYLPWWFASARWNEISSIRDLHAGEPERVAAVLAELAKEFPAALVRLARHATASELAEVLGNGRLRKFSGEGSGEPLRIVASWLARQAGGNPPDRFMALLSAAEQARVGDLLEAGSDNLRQVSAPQETDLESLGKNARRYEPRDPVAAPERAESGGLGIPIGTAGLVLLHPFLGRFFRHLGWLDDAGGLDRDFRWHAVQALQFLALGRCVLPEPTLVFEKTLCGIEPWEPAEFPAPDDVVRAECDDLLKAVIGHWPVLGKTSIDGLRESFLARPGLLFLEEERVRLAVEARPFDMLLDKLPWPLGPVMFRWLKRPISVRWRENEP